MNAAFRIGEGAPDTRFRYRNWRGEIAERQARPVSVWYGTTEWHPDPQWFLRAFDIDRGAERDFALRDMIDVRAVQP